MDQRAELGPAGRGEFGAGTVEMALDRADRDDQPVGDPLVAHSFRGQGDDLPFSACGRRPGGARSALAGVRGRGVSAATAAARVLAALAYLRAGQHSS